MLIALGISEKATEKKYKITMGSCPGISTKLFYLIKTVNYMSAVTSLFKSGEVD